MGTIEVTLKYGLKSISIDVPEGSSIRSMVQNASNKAFLGYPENVSAVIDGVTVALDESVSEGDVILLEKQAASKAA